MSVDPRTALENLFRSFDADNTGYLNKQQLRRFCHGICLTDDEFETIFSELDSDRDNRISLEDFVRGFSNSSQLLVDSKCEASNKSSTTDVTAGESQRNVTGCSGGAPAGADDSGFDAVFASLADEEASSASHNLRKPSVCWTDFIEEMGADFYILPPERFVYGLLSIS